MCEWVWDVPCMAMCCLLVCHGGSLHVPKRLIWAGAWHGIATVGGELARTVLARDCPKPTDLIRITAIISLSRSLSLCLSLFSSTDPHPHPRSIPRLLPTQSLASSVLLLFLLLVPHSSITTLQPTPQNQRSHWLLCCHGDSFHSFHFFQSHH